MRFGCTSFTSYLSLCPKQSTPRPGSSGSSDEDTRKPREKNTSNKSTNKGRREKPVEAKVTGYLIADQYVDASGTLFEDLVYLSGGNVEELSDLLCELGGGEILQVDGVINCGWTLAYLSLFYINSVVQYGYKVICMHYNVLGLR